MAQVKKGVRRTLTGKVKRWIGCIVTVNGDKVNENVSFLIAWSELKLKGCDKVEKDGRVSKNSDRSGRDDEIVVNKGFDDRGGEKVTFMTGS